MSSPTYDDALVDNNIQVMSIQSADCPVLSSSAGTEEAPLATSAGSVLPGRCFATSCVESVAE